MLDFSHITDLRASLPSDNFYNCFGSSHPVAHWPIKVLIILFPYVIFTSSESCTAAPILLNDITLTLIYSSTLDILSVPFCDPALVCPHLSAIA